MESFSLDSKIYRTIQDVSQSEWDSINAADDVFHTHAFLKDVEEAKVENSDFWYLMLYCDGKIVATAVLSAFVINLDLFVGAGAFIRLVRIVWPGFLKIKLLMCGVPASFGQKNILIAKPEHTMACLDLVSRTMEEIAEKAKIKYQAYKEFKEKEVASFEHLLHKGYFRAFSLPYAKMEIKWKDFSTYLNALRHGYRRQILSSLNKLGLDANFALNRDMEGMDLNVPKLIVTDSEVCTPELFYSSYLEVMKRASSKLETLNLDFFRNYFKSHAHKLIFIVLQDESRMYGAAVLVPHQKELTFSLIGKYSDKDEYDTYFNLIAAIVKYAIENDHTRINMGQTSYYPKLRAGATTENEYIYFKSKNVWIHGLLKIGNKVVFPETKLKNLKVFKE